MPYLPSARKIKRLDELATIVEGLKRDGKTIVQAHGVFDLVHPGHIYQFEQAKKLGDVLMVSVVDDRFVQKGSGRPFFNEEIRTKWLAALEIVDFVVLCGAVHPHDVIRNAKPHFYVKGEAYEPFLNDSQSPFFKDKIVCDSVGAELKFLKETKIHSTDLFEKLKKYFT